jgi:fructokinase
MALRPVIFGEVLFDCFPDHTTLGGAPFNVAWHLQGFELDPLFISRVGQDPLGQKVRNSMRDWGMSVEGLEEDADHPTGQVKVTLKHGEPTYEIVPEQAYDYIRCEALSAGKVPRNALLYHGTLATRGSTSRGSLKRLLSAGLARFVDVNLRAPWWAKEDVRALIRGAAAVKVNGDELRKLSSSDGRLEALAAGLQQELNIPALIVTLGEEGAFVRLSGGAIHRVEAPRPEPFVDAVGAGDAFSAIVIRGILGGWEWSVTLTRAASFAAQVCQWRGAFRNDRDVYRAIQAREIDGTKQTQQTRPLHRTS